MDTFRLDLFQQKIRRYSAPIFQIVRRKEHRVHVYVE